MTDPAAARRWTRQAVTALTGGVGAPRSAVPDDPLAALQALTALRAAVAGEERDAARRAREDGRTWAQIGERLGFGGDPDAAFLRVAERTGRYPSLSWRCPSCGELVTDYGPPLSAAADAEQGHAAGCERYAAAVAARDDADEGSGADG